MVIILLLQSSIFHVACCAECREKGAAKIANGRTTFSKKTVWLEVNGRGPRICHLYQNDSLEQYQTEKTILQDWFTTKTTRMASTVPLLRLVLAAFIEITRFYSRFRAFSGFSCRSNKLHSEIMHACFKGFFDENMQDSNNVLC